MRRVTAEEILAPEVFAKVRDRLRQAVMAHKAARRVPVGDRVTLVFEDRETVRWQVQEMCRVEGLRDADAIRQELDVYNELVPGAGELSATLFVEITDSHAIRRELDRLVGLDEHVALEIGDTRVPAHFDPKQLEEDRISAVHYLRFRVPPEQAAQMAEPSVPVVLRIDHPNYRGRATLGADTRGSLSVDLSGEPAPLLDPATLPDPPAPTLLATLGKARALRPASPAGPGHVIVESTLDVAFADAPAGLLADVLALAQAQSKEIRRVYGACQLALDTSSVPLRCHLMGTGA